MNLFMQYIYHKDDGLKEKIKFRKFIKSLKTMNPSFGFLWQFSDFVKDLEKVYFYDNNPKADVYSSDRYPAGSNGFKINTVEATITVKLISDDERIMIEIARKNGTNIHNTYSVTKAEWDQDMIESDNLLMENVINIIMYTVSDMLTEYYDKRRVKKIQ